MRYDSHCTEISDAAVLPSDIIAAVSRCSKNIVHSDVSQSGTAQPSAASLPTWLAKNSDALIKGCVELDPEDRWVVYHHAKRIVDEYSHDVVVYQ